MKKFTTSLACFALIGALQAQTQGPSSSQMPYLQASLSGSAAPTFTAVITATDVIINGCCSYTMAGIPDGLGAYDNNDGTFTLLMNHEMTSGAPGVTRAHGSNGAFVSKWIISKNTLAVQSGVDLIQNVKVWDAATSAYTTYNAGNPSTLAAFYRFCSADLAAPEAFYNKRTGLGSQARIFLNGEEAGAATDQNWAHVVTGSEAGTSYELPYFGKFSCENLVASPYAGNKTVVVGMDDSTPGQVYVYVGNKQSSGNEIEKAGLSGGILYGVAVVIGGTPIVAETNALNIPAGSTFSLISVASPNVVQAASVASLNTLSDNVGITKFLRPEDGAWDPSNPSDFYFNTTNNLNIVNNNTAAPTGNRSRVWKLHFTDYKNPELGGTITAVLDGTEGYEMLDNMTIDYSGHILLVEDVGADDRLGKVWQYDIATDILTEIAAHDPLRFSPTNSLTPAYLTRDEEASGILDVQAILGPGKFLTTVQAHYTSSVVLGSSYAQTVEGGQLLAFTNPASVANAEIDIQGNSVAIVSGNTVVSTNDNTNFGMVNVGGNNIQKAFVVKNTGSADLKVLDITLSGADAASFTITNAPWSFPVVIAPGTSQTITVSFNPLVAGTKSAIVNIVSNDYNETFYDFVVQAVAAVPEINVQGNSVNIVSGSSSTSVSDNTNFGSQVVFNPSVKSFAIQNTGNGTLTLSGITFNGANASEFSLINAPSFPVTLAGGVSQSFSVQFLPTSTGTRTTNIIISSNDSDEGSYTYRLEGEGGATDTGIESLSNETSNLNLFPNPSKDEATVKFTLKNNAMVSVKVFDIEGKLESVVTKKLTKGEQSVSISTINLQNGNYFVQVNAGGKIDTIKMVVAH